MKKLPIGIQYFSKIIEGDYVYVDKTQYIYNLINGASYNFLSRPRRFGKSLLLDTISEVFKGNKELFRGLWIYDAGYGFKKHPVIRIDMSNIANKTQEVLEHSLSREIRRIAGIEQVDLSSGAPSDLFKSLIEGVYIKHSQRVVVLIDEYDKPILDHITDIKTAEANRQTLRGFYGILKSMDPFLRFSLITGVTKFTKTSIFSELNNLIDITLTEDFADICGIPIESLDNEFREHINNLSTLKRFERYENIKNEILTWYDGYSWDGVSKVINPFSLISFFIQKRFGCFWYASGTPKFLVDFIKEKPESYLSLKNLKISERVLDSFDIKNMELEPLLFQTGYLTVKEVIETRGSPIYLLEIPNFEVRDAFSMQIVSALTEGGDARTERIQNDISESLQAGDLQRMLELLRSLFASIPFNLHVELEAYYHSIFYAVMTVLGFDMNVEVSTSRGRVDAALELDDKIYIMEFKYVKCPPDASNETKLKLSDKALDEAMAQINDRGYSAKYIGCGKTIYQAAFAFLGRDNIEMRAGDMQ